MRRFNFDKTWYNKENGKEYPIYKENKHGYMVKYSEAEGIIKKKDEKIKRLKTNLKICMLALQRETNHTPNYDVTESQMWVAFKEVLEVTE